MSLWQKILKQQPVAISKIDKLPGKYLEEQIMDELEHSPSQPSAASTNLWSWRDNFFIRLNFN
jgi:hypothetical protein